MMVEQELVDALAVSARYQRRRSYLVGDSRVRHVAYSHDSIAAPVEDAVALSENAGVAVIQTPSRSLASLMFSCFLNASRCQRNGKWCPVLGDVSRDLALASTSRRSDAPDS
jgi:hypothetical protein